MDFSKLAAVSNANPSGQAFDLKWSKAKSEFRFSDKLFASMQLEYNSLTQYENPEGIVLIGVNPANEGVFYKKQKGSVKGKRFKNEKLSAAVEAAGLGSKLTAVHRGANGAIEMYQIMNKADADNPYLAPEDDQVEEIDPNQMEIGEDKAEADVEPIKDSF